LSNLKGPKRPLVEKGRRRCKRGSKPYPRPVKEKRGVTGRRYNGFHGPNLYRPKFQSQGGETRERDASPDGSKKKGRKRGDLCGKPNLVFDSQTNAREKEEKRGHPPAGR